MYRVNLMSPGQGLYIFTHFLTQTYFFTNQLERALAFADCKATEQTPKTILLASDREN